MRHRRHSICIMSGWDKTCRVDICRSVPAPEFFRTNTYNPSPKSAARFQGVINDLLKQTHNRPSVEITMLGDTLFVDIEE